MSAPARLVMASPHLASGHSTPRIMWNVVGSLVPVIGAAAWLFGPSALLVIAAAVSLRDVLEAAAPRVPGGETRVFVSFHGELPGKAWLQDTVRTLFSPLQTSPSQADGGTGCRLQTSIVKSSSWWPCVKPRAAA